MPNRRPPRPSQHLETTNAAPIARTAASAVLHDLANRISRIGPALAHTDIMSKRLLRLAVLTLVSIGASLPASLTAAEESVMAPYCYPFWPITVCCDAATCWVQKAP